MDPNSDDTNKKTTTPKPAVTLLPLLKQKVKADMNQN